ncbi:MAG: YicC/YloC family endoribonuclease, partial [Bacteroidia bacterium]|nr:YicC/YloC family endoribonuclease [Bacteroidia bacterium]
RSAAQHRSERVVRSSPTRSAAKGHAQKSKNHPSDLGTYYMVLVPLYRYFCNMITSMTGFGNTVHPFDDYQIQCEIKCLNSKSIEFSLNIPRFLNEREIEIRNLLTQKLERGRIYMGLCIEFDVSYPITRVSIDKTTALSYWNEMKNLANLCNVPISESSFIQLLQFNEIWKKIDIPISDGLWQDIVTVIEKTIEKVNAFRDREGKNTAVLIKQSVHKIQNLVSDIEKYEPTRIDALKERLLQVFNQYQITLNEDRFMQELVYYAERYDIAEERTRLLHHCQYFMENLESPQNNGKKLQFIVQEMHREINTLGVKSNHIEIQKLVVLMKEEVEKIKEQLNNVV